MKKHVIALALMLIAVSVFAQTYLINESFEGTFPPTGWTNNGCILKSVSARTGSYCLGFNGVNDAIYTPQLSNPIQLSFWYRRSSNSTAWTLNVQVSTNASTWTSIGNITNATETYQQYTYDLSSYSGIYVRMLDQRSSGTNERYVDDFTITTLNAPTATEATIIGNNSFTANWNSVSGANGYELDVYTKTLTELVNTGFEGAASFPDGWTQNSSYVNNNSSEAHTGTYYAGMNGSGDYFYTPSLTSPTTINFWIKASSATANNTTKVQYSTDASTWTELATYSANGSDTGDVTAAWSQKTINANLSGNYYIRWYMSARSGGSAYFDDVMITNGSRTYVLNDQNVNNVTSYAVTGLNANTQYYYVVRAYNASGTSGNSTEIPVQTINYDYPNGNPVTSDGVTVTFNTGDGNNSSTGTSTAPNPNFTATFKKVITLVGSGPWNITLSAPVGSVPWFAYRRGTTWTSYANTTGTVTIDVDAKKDAEIEIQGGSGQDPTLPVELSSFMATLTAQNTVSVMWVTQSETNVNGYYVYRGMSSDLQEASTVSPLIPATNTSQQQMYQYTDSEVFEPGTYYYWLQVQDLDGSIQFHGPTTVFYDNSGSGTPDIPKVTELKSVYPNPFNPSTTISYSLAKAETVDFVIYNNRGQIVRSFNEGSKGIGNHSFNWFGDDQNGRACSTGVYYIKMQAGKDSFIRKAVLMK